MKYNTKILVLILIIVALGASVYYKKMSDISTPSNPSSSNGEFVPASSTSTSTSSTSAPTRGGSQAKINIDVVCQGALAYMTFKDGASADAFVAECKEGKHPEVIERFKADMNLGGGAQI